MWGFPGALVVKDLHCRKGEFYPWARKIPWRRKWQHTPVFSSVQLLSLCDPMDCSTPGLPVHHQLPELAQTPIHQVSDAIQPSHPLASPSPPTFNPSQHQGLFQRVSSLHLVAKSIGASASASILLMNVQDWFPLGLSSFISLQYKGLSRDFSNTTVPKHQFFGAQLSL